jgi:hypothetical protein
MKIPMEVELALALLGLGLSIIALALAYYSIKRRQTQMAKESVVVAKRLAQPVMTIEPQTPNDVQSKLNQVSAGIKFLVDHFKIEKEITEYGSLIMDAYDNFMAGVSDEFEVLEQRKVEGPEYHFRSNMLLFSLMMARVYMGLYASEASLHKLEGYIERAKRLV